MDRARSVTGAQITDLEALWRTRPTATLDDLNKPETEGAWGVCVRGGGEMG